MTNKEKLERIIVDASDGLLSKKELLHFESRLKEYPDLYRDYQLIMGLPGMDELYPQNQAGNFQQEIESVRQKLSGLEKAQRSFEEISIVWFQKYALAASLFIFALTSLYTFSQTEMDTSGDDLMLEELFYPPEESAADVYQWYLEELTEQ